MRAPGSAVSRGPHPVHHPVHPVHPVMLFVPHACYVIPPSTPERRMRDLSLAFTLASMAATTACATSGSGAGGESTARLTTTDTVPRYPIEDFLGTTNFGGASWSPD